MPRGATVAANNKYYLARKKASEKNSMFSNRDDAASVLCMDKSRLAKIELGNIDPNSDDIYSMARAYEAPELCNYFCSTCCPIGRESVPQLDVSDFDRIVLQVLGACEDIEDLRSKLIAIASDGDVKESENRDFLYVLEILNKLSIGAQALMLWSKKNIETID